MSPVLKTRPQQSTLGLRGLLSESAAFTSSIIASQVSRFAVNLFALSRVTPEGMGIWNSISAVLVYATVANLGSVAAMNRELPILLGNQDWRGAEHMRQTAWSITVWASSVCALGFCITPLFLPQDIPVRPTVALAAVLFFSDQVFSFIQASLRCDLRFREVTAKQWTLALLLPVLTCPSVMLFKLPGYVLGQALAYLGAAFIAQPMKALYWPKRVHSTDFARIAKVGLPLLSVAFMFGLVISVDRWVILSYFGIEALGHFSLAILMTSAMYLIPSAIAQQLYPRMAHAFGKDGNTDAVRPWLKYQLILSGSASVLIGLSAIIALPFVVSKVLPHYHAGLASARIVTVGLMALPLTSAASNLVNLLNRQFYHLAVQSVTILLKIGLGSLAAAHGAGLNGIATSVAVAYLFYAGALNIIALRLLQTRRRCTGFRNASRPTSKEQALK